MKYFYNTILFVLIFLLFFGCSENSAKLTSQNKNLLPQYIKKIAIVKFQDSFNQPAFQEKLYYTIKDKFTTDRRIQIVNIEDKDSDAVLVGSITRYILQPLEYDSNKKVTKYSLWVWVDISLYDAYTERILWTENHLEAKVEYNTLSDAGGFFNPTTETEAQDAAIDKLANSIVKRTIDGWFAVSGATQTIYS